MADSLGKRKEEIFGILIFKSCTCSKHSSSPCPYDLESHLASPCPQAPFGPLFIARYQ